MAVEVDAPDQLPALVDERRIRQVLDNLLSNAVKYGGVGGAVTVVLRQGVEATELEVRDAGFFRGGEALERHIPGTGLGLNIVSTIVAAHNGAVTLEREVGRGSIFRVALPHQTV